MVTDKTVTSQDESRHWSYLYDLRGKLIKLNDPEQNMYSYTYDSLGNLVDVYQNGSHTTHNVYNGLSWNLEEVNVADNTRQQYKYHRNGDVAVFTDKASQKHDYTYNEFDQLTITVIYSRKGEVLYEDNRDYNKVTLLLERESNSSGNSIEYGYDHFRRMNSQEVAGKTYAIQYQAGNEINPYNINDLDDLMDGLTYSNGDKVSYTYDDLGRIKSVVKNQMKTVDYQYSSNSEGDTVTTFYRDEETGGKRVKQYRDSFGELNQLLKPGSKAENMTYDGFGNLATKESDGETWSYTYDKIDRLLTEESSTSNRKTVYEYDEKGNRKEVSDKELPLPQENRSYEYDALNRLTKASVGEDSYSYTYYPNGLSATKEGGGDNTRYVYLNGHVIEELDQSGKVKAMNVFGNEPLYRQTDDGQSGYFLNNYHGDVVSIVDKNWKVLNKYDYDVWGNPIEEKTTESMDNPFRYAGEVFDKETGYYYFCS